MEKPRYIEPLMSGGELVVTKDEWHIYYYFMGPDLRHNGESVFIPGIDVDKYIQAYKTNFQKFVDLLNIIPKDGNFSTKGECDMTISCGKFHPGISIAALYNHLNNSCFPISNEHKLNQVLADYNYCKQKAQEIQKLLFAV